jgi:hypothetical protein
LFASTVSPPGRTRSIPHGSAGRRRRLLGGHRGPGRGGPPSAHDTFRFHELAIEDALAEIHHPKIEAYNGLLYLDPARHRAGCG